MHETELSRWPLTVEIPVAWGDMDALGHVNNVVYLRWFETARVIYFERTGLFAALDAQGHGPILARQTIDYRLPITYPDVARVQTTVTRFGNTSFAMAFKIHSTSHGAVAAEGEGFGVLINYRSGEKIPLDGAFKAAVLAFEASGTGGC